MKKLLILLLIPFYLISQKTNKRISLTPIDKYTATPAFKYGVVKQYINGTLNSLGTEFVDVSGNGFNLVITGKDWDGSSKGFPYKSAATVAQKAANFGLIPNPNYFWFTSGGTPNQIPVTSLFQDVDYADQIFTKHDAQKINGDSTEYQEPSVREIVTYASTLTGTPLTNAKVYFGVPTEITSNVYWVDYLNGSDAAAGTRAAPFKTLEKANTLAASKTIYIKSAAITVTASVYFASSSSWKFIGCSPITSTATPVIGASATSSFVVEGAEVMAASGGRACYFISGTNDTIRRCKLTATGSGSKCFQTLAGTSNHIQSCVIITSQDQPAVDIRLVAPSIYGCYFGGSPTVEPLSWNTTSPGTGQKIYYNKFGYTLAANKTVFLFNKAGNYYVKFNTFRTTAGSSLQTLLAGSTMTGTVHWKYNDIKPTSLTSGVILFTNTTNTVNTDISYNKIIVDATNACPNNIISVIEQPAMTINYNYIDMNILSAVGINIYATAAKGAADISYNTILGRKDGGTHIVCGSDVNATYDNCYNGSTIIGNVIYGVWYFNPTSATNLSHGIAVFDCVDTKIKYNYVNGANHLVVLKASDRAASMTNTACVVQYNVGINNDGSLFAKTMSGIKFLNNTTYCDNNMISTAISGGVYLLSSTGTTSNTTIQNNIFIDATSNNSNTSMIRIDPTGSQAGLTCDYNVYYSTNTNYIGKVLNPGTINYSFAAWQGLGYDANSLYQSVPFNSIINEQFWPVTSLPNGTNTTFSSGLDITTQFKANPPIINLKSQSGTYQLGAYVQ